MDAINLCNAIRMEFEGVFEKKIPLEAFPAKIQDNDIDFSKARELYHRVHDGFSFGGSINRHR